MKNLIYLLLFVPTLASGQMLAEESKVEIALNGDHKVVLYAADDCEQCYYYLPSGFKTSHKKDRTPEVSLVTWKNDSESKTVGAIFHLLVDWDMTADIEKCVEISLRSEVDSMAVVMGPASVRSVTNQLAISGNGKLAEILRASASNQPLASNTPGSKMAFSFRITEERIDDFLYYVKNPNKTSAHIQAAYDYQVIRNDGTRNKEEVIVNIPFREILQLVKAAK